MINFSRHCYMRLKRVAVCCALMTLFIACTPLHAPDVLLTSPFYHGSRFILRDNAAVDFLHSYAGKIPALIAALWFLRVAFFPKSLLKVNSISPRKAALYALFTMLLSIGLVNLLKKLTGMDCPWDLKIYGGSAEASFPLYETLHSDFSGHCWPSGFSGGIFSLYAWCFYLCVRDKGKRTIILAFSLITALGLLGGVMQIARGAHFPSHIIAAMTFDYSFCFFLMSALLKRAAKDRTIEASKANL